jgi:oligogalacturonide lyase
LRIEAETGRSDVLHEESCYIGHTNTSPTNPQAVTFCHEGPWGLVDQRMWGLNVATGKVWKIREQQDDVSVGHEYWFSDGNRIGYHGRSRSDASVHTFGIADWESGDYTESDFPFHSTHFHSLDEHLIVGDGTPFFAGRDDCQPYIQLYRREGTGYSGPKALAFHRSTFNDQHAHCHPRFTPDGHHVLYTSDLTAYSNMYLVEVGDYDNLQDLPSVLEGRAANP